MKKMLAVLAALLTCGASAAPVALKNAGFDAVDKAARQPVGWSRHENWRGARVGMNGSGGFEFSCTSEVKNPIGPGQDVVLKAGRRYRFSATVRTEGIKTVRKSPYKGITVGLSAFDASGKRIWMQAARPCAVGTKDWSVVECATPKMPAGTVKGRIALRAVEVVDGRACVDSVYLEEIDGKAIDGVYSSAYRDEAMDGPVKFMASLNLDSEIPVGDYSCSFSCRAGGGMLTEKGVIDGSGAATAMLDVSRMDRGTNDVKFALFRRGALVEEATLRFVRLSAPPTRRVWVDSHFRTIVDGKPFFPIGMYMRQLDPAKIDTYAEGPFNCLCIEKDPNPPLKDLDRCHSKGLKVICNLRAGIDDADGGEKWVAENIRLYRDHPAVLAWYICDELPLAYVPRLRARRSWAEALDPDHPTWTALNKPELVRYYMGTFDVLGLDRYPIPKQPTEFIIKTVRDGAESTCGIRSAWQIPQAFAWGWLKRRETKGMRAPTRKEMASMSWQWLAGGANGLLYYSFSQICDRHELPDDAFEPAWERTKSMAAEIRRYEDVFLSTERPLAFSGATESVAVRTWRHGGRNYLLAVNCTTSPQKATIRLATPLGKGVVADLGEMPAIDGNSVSFDFGPLDYAMIHD